DPSVTPLTLNSSVPAHAALNGGFGVELEFSKFHTVCRGYGSYLAKHPPPWRKPKLLENQDCSPLLPQRAPRPPPFQIDVWPGRIHSSNICVIATEFRLLRQLGRVHTKSTNIE